MLILFQYYSMHRLSFFIILSLDMFKFLYRESNSNYVSFLYNFENYKIEDLVLLDEEHEV